MTNRLPLPDTVLLVLVALVSLASLASLLCITAHSPRGRSAVRASVPGRFEYIEVDGHEYLLWRQYGNKGGITHSPKCKCLKGGGE